MSEYRSNIKPLYGTPLARSHWASSGLCGNWIFNEGSGLIAHDDSGNGFLGSIYSAGVISWWPVSEFGNTLSFIAGNSSCVSLVNRPQLNNFTIIGRIMRTISANMTPITMEWVLGKYYRIQFGLGDTVNLYVYNGTTSYPIGSVPTILGKWYHVAATRLVDTNSLYVDGNLTGSQDSALATCSDVSSFLGGRKGSSYLYYLTGNILNVSLYNRALSPSEIQYLYMYPYCMYEDQAGMQAWLYQQQLTMFRRGMTARTGARL